MEAMILDNEKTVTNQYQFLPSGDQGLGSAWVSPTFITILGWRWQAGVINHHIKP